jgi:hypothetical protein
MSMKIATLIPAYRLDYFTFAINSVLRQTVKPGLIIVSDDSPNGEISTLIESGDWPGILKTKNIVLQVVAGPRKKSAYLNLMNLCEVWDNQTEFFHFLFDDDYIFPLFYQKHLLVLTKNDLMASVSRRWQGDTLGQVIGAFNIPNFIENSEGKQMSIEPSALFKSVVPQCDNWLGEYSNTLFHKTSMDALKAPELGGYSTYGLDDIGIFLSLGKDRKLGFINEHLGFFRSHENQNTGNLDNPDFLAAHLAWIPIAMGSEKLGLINKDDKDKVIKNILNTVINRYQKSDVYDIISGFFGQFLNPQNRIEPFSESDFLKCWELFVTQRKAGYSFKA